MLTSLPSVPSKATLTRTVVCAPANRPPRVSSRRVTALRAPSLRRPHGSCPGVEGAALAVAAVVEACWARVTISISATGRTSSVASSPASTTKIGAREHEVLAEEDRDQHERRCSPSAASADVETGPILAQAMDEDEAVVLVILDYQYFLRFEHA